MANYSKIASEKMEKVMHEKKAGTLKSGSGKKVKSKNQAIAIGLSEAREAGAKVPKKATVTKKEEGRRNYEFRIRNYELTWRSQQALELYTDSEFNMRLS